MASVSTYLIFDGKTEEAFEFYKTVFRTEYVGGIFRMGDAPPQEGMPPVTDDVKNLVMNVQLPITGGHLLMGNDVVAAWGHQLIVGNNTHILLNTDTREEADWLYDALSDGGTVEMPMADQFWGDYFGDCIDAYGIHWMIAHTAK